MNEIFKDIPGFEGIYQVSNLGNVKSLKRIEWRETSYHSGHWATRKEKMLTPMNDREGYVHVRLCKNHKFILWKVHQLVAYAFLGHDRKNRNYIVHHLNHNKKDNRLINLEVIERGQHIRGHKKGEL